MKHNEFKILLQLILKIIIIIFKILFFFLFISILLSILINTCFCMPESRSSNPGDGNGGAIISIILIIIGAAIAIVYDSTKHDTSQSPPLSPPQSPSASMLDLKNFEKNFPNPNKSINIPDIVDNKLYNLFSYCSFYIGILAAVIAFYNYNFLGFKDFGEKYKLKIKYNYPRFYKYRYLLIVLFCWSILLFISIYNK